MRSGRGHVEDDDGRPRPPCCSVLALAGLVLLAVSGRGGGPRTQLHRSGRERAPLAANFAAVGVDLPALVLFSGRPAGVTALLLASSGSLLAVAGAALVLRSRVELGAAWSLVPNADAVPGSSPPALTASCVTPSTLVSCCSPWAKRSPWQLASPCDRVGGDRPDLRLARPRGGEAAWPQLWRALRRVPGANQVADPVPALNAGEGNSALRQHDRVDYKLFCLYIVVMVLVHAERIEVIASCLTR